MCINYINGYLLEGIQHYMFADDATLEKGVWELEDCIDLQNDHDKVSECSYTW